MKFWVCFAGGAAVLLMAAQAHTAWREANAEYPSVLIEDVPHVKQKPDFCGEACVEMYLSKLGKQIDQDFVFDQAKLDPLEGRGCYTFDLVNAVRRIGFRTGDVWYAVTQNSADAQLEGMFQELHRDLKAGIPSIVCMRYDEQPETTEHFRLVLGYDAVRDSIVFHEPAVARGAYRHMKKETFLSLWPLKYETNRWTVVRIRLQPARIVNARSSQTLSNADYAQRVMSLKQELAELKTRQIRLKQERDEEIRELTKREMEKEKEAAAAGQEYKRKTFRPRIVSNFYLALQEPFVVVGDESQQMVDAWASGTIQWAVQLLKQDFFPKNPDHVITIWLFGSDLSYRQNVRDIFGTRPTTPFGYYSPRERVLVMNIDTGGGTLVHEIVHPFMAANFPRCPSWFNEGLGSLFEQCEERGGRIRGLTNWRLQGLQKAIEDEAYQMPTFEELCGTTDRGFYSYDPGTNYAQARYLCYYLQQNGLLRQFYREFVRDAKDDPTGYKTLQRLLAEDDMELFQKKWNEYVLALEF